MSLVSGTVLRSQSGQLWVHTEGGTIHCRLRGRLKQGRAHTDLAVIGDRVQVQLLDDGGGAIESVEPRQNRFARRQPGSRGKYKEDVLVANLDLLIVVMACTNPTPNPRLIDRFLALAEIDGVEVALVANKIDLVEHAAAHAIFAPYQRLGYAVVYASAPSGEGIAELRELVSKRLCACVGPSGVGKSSLLNALEPTLLASVGDVSSLLEKGKHTTRVAELHPLTGGGWLADTPGIRELASFELPEREVARGFREMQSLDRACAFSDCLHLHEPRCAVRAAVDEGVISPERYDSYLRILRGEDR